MGIGLKSQSDISFKQLKMGLLHFEKNADYCYGIWKMDEDENKLRNILENGIAAPQKNQGKRIEFLSVRALAKWMDIDPMSIEHLSSGRPYLKDSKTGISISHTKGYVAIMLSDIVTIGTDIEQRSDRVQKVAHKFMHPEELENISKLSCSRSLALLLHWSAKEALFKAIPDEGVDFAKDLRILEFSAPSEKGRFMGKALRSGMAFQIDYRVEKDFVFTTCYPISEI